MPAVLIHKGLALNGCVFCFNPIAAPVALLATKHKFAGDRVKPVRNSRARLQVYAAPQVVKIQRRNRRRKDADFQFPLAAAPEQFTRTCRQHIRHDVSARLAGVHNAVNGVTLLRAARRQGYIIVAIVRRCHKICVINIAITPAKIRCNIVADAQSRVVAVGRRCRARIVNLAALHNRRDLRNAARENVAVTLQHCVKIRDTLTDKRYTGRRVGNQRVGQVGRRVREIVRCRRLRAVVL